MTLTDDSSRKRDDMGTDRSTIVVPPAVHDGPCVPLLEDGREGRCVLCGADSPATYPYKEDR